MPTGFISAIVVGASIGWFASIVARTNVQMGSLWYVILGMFGAILGSWIVATTAHTPLLAGVTPISFLACIAGALLPILIARGIASRRMKKQERRITT